MPLVFGAESTLDLQIGGLWVTPFCVMVRSHVVPLPCTSPILLTSPRLALSYYGQQAQCLGAKRLVIAPATVLTSDWEEEGYEFSPYDLQQLAEYHQNRKVGAAKKKEICWATQADCPQLP